MGETMKLWQGALIMLGSAAIVGGMGIVGLGLVADCHLVFATSRETYEFSDPRLGGTRIVSKPRIEKVHVLVCGTKVPEGLVLKSGARIDGGAGP